MNETIIFIYQTHLNLNLSLKSVMNHLIKNVQNFLIIKEIDFIESFEQTFDLFDLAIDLNMKIIYHKKVLIVAVKQNKYDFNKN